MAKKVVDEKLVSGMPYTQLVESTRAALQDWNAMNSALQLCLFKTAAGGLVMDPNALLQVTTDIRGNVDFLVQVGEAAVAEAETWARQEIQAASVKFDSALRKLSAEHDISLQGRFPSYVLGGFLNVRWSQKDGICSVGGKKLKTLLLDRVWPEIASAIKHESLRQWTPENFVAACHAAYKRANALRNGKLGTPVPIKELFRELIITLQSDRFWRSPQRENFSEYTEEYFARDLAKLIGIGLFLTPAGARMELLPTSFPKDAISVVDGEGVRYIGQVAFGEVNQ